MRFWVRRELSFLSSDEKVFKALPASRVTATCTASLYQTPPTPAVPSKGAEIDLKQENDIRKTTRPLEMTHSTSKQHRNAVFSCAIQAVHAK